MHAAARGHWRQARWSACATAAFTPRSAPKSKLARGSTLISTCGYSFSRGRCFGERRLVRAQRAQHLQRRHDAVAGRVVVEADDVPRILRRRAPSRVPAASRARSGRRPSRARTECSSRASACSSAEVGHQRADDAAAQLRALLHAMASQSRTAAGRRRRSCPLASTMTSRSPSPSNAMPRSARSRLTASCSAWGCVAPHSALMLKPSG